MSKKRFKPLGANKWLPVVHPQTGEIIHARYAENLAGGIVEVRGGQPRIGDSFADKGYKFLSEYYQDPAEDDDIRANGFKVYMDYMAACELRQVEHVTVEGRPALKPLDPDWIPAKVIAMQRGIKAGTHAAPKRAKKKAAKSATRPG